MNVTTRFDTIKYILRKNDQIDERLKPKAFMLKFYIFDFARWCNVFFYTDITFKFINQFNVILTEDAGQSQVPTSTHKMYHYTMINAESKTTKCSTCVFELILCD